MRSENDSLKKIDSVRFIENASNALLDNEGNYWFTTLDQGICMIPNEKVRIFKPTGLKEQVKLSCINSNEKNRYVGLPEGKILMVDDKLNAKVFEQSKGPTAVSSITFTLNGEPQANLDHKFDWYKEVDVYRTKILQIAPDTFILGMTGGLTILGSHNVVYKSRLAGFTKRISEICRLTDTKYLIGTYTGLYYLNSNK